MVAEFVNSWRRKAESDCRRWSSPDDWSLSSSTSSAFCHVLTVNVVTCSQVFMRMLWTQLFGLFLLSGDNCPECTCQCPNTVKDILIACVYFNHIRPDYFVAASVRELFEKKSTHAKSSILLPRCIEWSLQTRSSDSVWPSLSVRLVCQTRAMWQNGRKICPDFYNTREII